MSRLPDTLTALAMLQDWQDAGRPQPANDGRREPINPIIAAYLGSCTGLQAVAAEGVLRKLTKETGRG